MPTAGSPWVQLPGTFSPAQPYIPVCINGIASMHVPSALILRSHTHQSQVPGASVVYNCWLLLEAGQWAVGEEWQLGKGKRKGSFSLLPPGVQSFLKPAEPDPHIHKEKRNRDSFCSLVSRVWFSRSFQGVDQPQSVLGRQESHEPTLSPFPADSLIRLFTVNTSLFRTSACLCYLNHR